MAEHHHIANDLIAGNSKTNYADVCTNKEVAKLHPADDVSREKPRSMAALTDGYYKEGTISQTPSYLLARPLYDFDATGNGVPSEETFLVLSRRTKSPSDQAYRFNMAKSLFLFGPLHPLRLYAIKIVTNQYFEFFVILIILINCICLALNNPPEKAEYMFAFIYTSEMFLKIIARGFVMHSYAYIRNPWNCLDFSVVILGYVTFSPNVANFSGIRTVRVFRALRAISVMKGLKAMVNTLLRSLKLLSDVLVLFLFFLCVMALIGLQLFVGHLRYKCVLNDPHNLTISLAERANDPSLWYYEDDTPVICGNSSTARACPENYTCLPDAGPNPDFGYTNFDHMGWSLVLSFQLLTMDFWENIYNKIVASTGAWCVVYFLGAIFFCSFYLLNLVLAVVALSYELEIKSAHKEHERQRREKKTAVSYPADAETLEHLHPITTRVQVLIKTIHSIRTQKKIDEFTRSAANSPESPSWFRLIASKNSFKEILNEKLKNDTFRTDMSWRRRLQRIMCAVVGHPIVEFIIMGCILANTVVLALHHHQINEEFKRVLDVLNLMFTIIFTVEMILKLAALGPLYYLQGRWNIFDGIIVVISLLDTGLELANFRESSGTSVFRTFRLVRILKLAQSWKTMRRLLATIANSVGPIGNITLILALVIYIFALLGMKMFGKAYTPEKFDGQGVPRWNFNDFWHAFMMVFRVLCGEWIEPLWDCMRATSPAEAIPFFIPAVVIGNFIVLNLFLALLLNAFDDSDEDEVDENENGEEADEDENESKLKAFLHKLTHTKKTCVFHTPRENNTPCHEIEIIGKENGKNKSTGFPLSKRCSTVVNIVTNNGTVCLASRQNRRASNQVAEINDCFPECCLIPCTRLPACANNRFTPWLKFRWWTRQLVEHKYFEWFILMTVLVSSLVLVFEDVYLPSKPRLEKALEVLNYFFAFIFALEFTLKIIGLGVVGYFSSCWNCLDSLIVAISLVCVFQDTTLTFFRSLRTVRALRPLRAVSRMEGMKVVVNALFSAIPGIGNVLLVSLLFWLIFSILGVQLFAGRFYKCIGNNGERVSADIVPNKTECLKDPDKYRWVNSDVNFDNVINGFLALFQVATFEGWMELMEDAVDAKEVDEQPSDESYLSAYIYFVIFITVGAFFVLNLFVGVIIDNFNSLKKRYDELSCMGMLLTEAQRKWVNILREAARKKPNDESIRPKNKFLNLLYDLVASELFEITILGMIMLNMTVMMWQHYRQSQLITDTLPRVQAAHGFNWFFTTIFIMEAILKLSALRHHYFEKAWNIFDFVIVITSIIGLGMDELTSDDNSIINLSLLRVFRVARVARLLRILQFAKGIRQLLVALIISLPALFNVGTLLFLVIFIYAIIGMSTFGHVKKQGNLDDTVNFETFGRSMMLLFRLSTGAGWNDVLESLMLSPPDCDPNFGDFPNGNCGYPAGAVIYLVSYIFIVFLIIVNMYIAIILENVNRAQEGGLVITKDNLDSYYKKWSTFVSDGKQYLQVYQVSEFVALLDEPLKIAKPNEQELVRMGINVRMGYRVQCFDLLRCLVKRLLEKQGQSPEAFEEIASKLEAHFRRRLFRRKSTKAAFGSNEMSSDSPCDPAKEDRNSPTVTENVPTGAKPDSPPKNTAAPRTRYRDPFSTAMLVQSALRRFLDRHPRAGVNGRMSNAVSSDYVGKCSCSPLSSVSSDQEINSFMSGLDFTQPSPVQTPSGNLRSASSPGCGSDDPYDSEGDSV